MFKQFLQAQALDYVQVDACRLGGLNEVMAVMLMAAKFQVPLHPVGYICSLLKTELEQIWVRISMLIGEVLGFPAHWRRVPPRILSARHYD